MKTREKKKQKKVRAWKKPINFLLLIILGTLLIKGAAALGFLSHIKDTHSAWFATTEVMAENQNDQETQDAKVLSSNLESRETYSSLASSSHSLSYGDHLSALEKRESELRRRERELQQKEELLNKMEEDVQQKFEALSAIQKEIQDFQAERSSQRNARIRSLVRIYESMKPREAAQLLENMEEQLVVNIISTMNTEVAANILATMDTQKAARISQVLSAP